MACRIDRLLAERHLVVLRISGRIAGDDVDVLRSALDQERGAIAIDLAEVGLVDRGAVNLLRSGEMESRPRLADWILVLVVAALYLFVSLSGSPDA